MSENMLLDEVLLADYISTLGMEIFQQMLDLYSEQSSIYLQDIKLAATAGDDHLWHEKCHKLKGAASSIGFLTLRAFILTIENSKEDSEIKQYYYERLNDMNIASIAIIKAWLNRHN